TGAPPRDSPGGAPVPGAHAHGGGTRRDVITLGVEEEYLLLDPDTAVPLPLAEEVRAAAGLQTIARAGEIQPELLLAQVEVATPVCGELAELGRHLLRLRHAIAAAAATAGCRAIASGAAPLTGPGHPPVTDKPRYRELSARGACLVDEQLVNGMHVHAAVPDRSAGVAVLNRIRLWLPVLVAMAGNSPLWRGEDTGFASWRTVIFGRWPVAGPPPAFADGPDYDRRVADLVSSGAIADTGQIYWQARLSEHYPTIEVRCFDVQLTVEDAVMFAGIVRALVATALREEDAGLPVPPCPPEVLHAANWHAARHGLGDRLIGLPCRSLPAAALVRDLLEHLAPALADNGDGHEVASLLRGFLARGAPATRQRRALATGGIRALGELIACESPRRSS
ncbi:glutamate--cysteine ligase, partial [Streptomyces sp. NPDC046215]